MLVAGVATWVLLVGGFWWSAQAGEAGAIATLLATLERLADHPWAAAGVFALYLLRPLLLLPITTINLASGFVLGWLGGLPLALAGTLASASIGYLIGRGLARGAQGETARPSNRLTSTLQQNGFISVAAGGLMYLHADAVNLPAGMLRIRYPIFLAGIVVGNSLTMTSAVIAGASAQGLGDATVSLRPEALLLALALFALSLLLAYALRRRTRNRERRRGPLAS